MPSRFKLNKLGYFQLKRVMILAILGEEKPMPPENIAQLERDLWVYCTSNADKYLTYFRRAYIEIPNRGVQRSTGMVLSWNWPAFFFSFAWLLYRKLFLLGFLFLGINTGITLLIPGNTWIEWVLWLALKSAVAVNAKSVYVDKAVNKIRASRAKQIPVREWEAHLQEIGGVSYLGVLLAVAVWVVPMIYIIRTVYA